MCVIFFYANSNPAPGGYKLILASNRDEFYARETLEASKWANAEHVYGGIDLEPGREGGTWLAVSGHRGVFKVGALLNLTGEPKLKDALAPPNIIMHSNHNNNTPDDVGASLAATTTTTTIHNNHFLLGRGMIVSDFVKSYDDGNTIDEYNRSLVSDCSKYNAFNFISIEIGACNSSARITHCSNAPASCQTYTEGHCYGFGNSLPAAPFEKVRFGQQRFQSIVETFHLQNVNSSQFDSSSNRREEQLVQPCLELLKCKQKFWPDAELQRRAPNWGEELSALNVIIPHASYGSRTHSVILIDDNNKLHFYEETMKGVDPEGKWTTTHIEKQYFDN